MKASEKLARGAEGARWRTLMESSPGLIHEIDRDGKILYINRATPGFDRETVIGSSIYAYVKPGIAQFMREQVKEVFERSTVVSFEVPAAGPYGSEAWFACTIGPIVSDDVVVAAIMNSIDVTERKTAVDGLRASEARFRALIENSGDMIIVLERNGVVRYASPSVKKVMGYNPHDLVGLSIFELVHPDDMPRIREELMDFVGDGADTGKKTTEARIRHADGTWHLHEGRGTNLLNDPDVRGFVLNSTDITDRKKAQGLQDIVYRISQAAVESQNLQDLFRVIHTSICEVMKANNFYIALYDREKDLLSFPYFVDEVDTQFSPMRPGKGLTAYVLRTGKSLLLNPAVNEELERQGEIELIGAPSEVWLGVPLRVEDKTIGVMVVQDYKDPRIYTEQEQRILEYVSSQVAMAINRKQSEEALRASEGRYRSLFESMLDGVYRSTHEGRFVDVNPSMVKMFGYSSQEEMLKTDIKKDLYFSPSDRESLFLDTGQERIEIFRMKRKDGSEIWVEDHGHYVHDGEGTVVFHEGILRDVTERAHAEEALRASEEKYRSLFEESKDAIFISTTDGRLVDINPAGLELFGVGSKSELLNVNLVDEFYVNPQGRSAAMELLAKQGYVKDLEVKLRRRTGLFRTVLETTTVVKNPAGDIVGYRGILRDVTERKMLEEELMQVQKMDSIGTLAGGVAHDFNNILAIILGQLSLIDRFPMGPDQLRRCYEVIRKAVDRGATLVRQILTFARKAEAMTESVRLNDMIEDISQLIRETFPKTITISLELDGKLPSIIADRTQIHQAILNLVVNARDAMPKGGTLTIVTSTVSSREISGKFPKADAEQYACIAIADTGVGMDDTTKLRIFEPFFTTKGVGKGTGLGLAVTYGVVTTHQGFIDVESDMGKGSKFCLYLPVPLQKIDSRPEAPRIPHDIPGGTETILVIEDEDPLRELLVMFLGMKGYNVLIATDGVEAVEVFQEHAKEIDLVLSDIGLPKIDGWEAYQKMKLINPSLKVIFASGYLDGNRRAEMITSGVRDFVQKPFDTQEVLKKVRDVLENRR